MATQTAQVPTTTGTDLQEIRIVSHSNLFYWWPVWAVGFIMALITGFSGFTLATVPVGTEAEAARNVEGTDGPRDVLIAPANRELPRDPDTKKLVQPKLHISPTNN